MPINIGGLVGLVVGAYILAMLLLLVWAARAAKVWGAIAVLVPFLGFPTFWFSAMHWQSYKLEKHRQARQALFEERCRTAGIKIYKTAEDVEEVFLMKLRSEKRLQLKNHDVSPDTRPVTGYWVEDYIRSYFWGRDQQNQLSRYGLDPKIASTGYRYVGLIHPQTGERMRYEARIKTKEYRLEWETAPCDPAAPVEENRFMLCPIPLTGPGPRYGVTFDIISIPEDHDHDIVGSSLQVIDLETGEMMAERISYNALYLKNKDSYDWIDTAYDACPRYWENQQRGSGNYKALEQTRDFVEQVLKPKQYLKDEEPLNSANAVPLQN